jgi:hypothetical protein
MGKEDRHCQGHRERQLVLFAREWVPWETLPTDVHGPAIEFISLLFEQALNWKDFGRPEEEDDA